MTQHFSFGFVFFKDVELLRFDFNAFSCSFVFSSKNLKCTWMSFYFIKYINFGVVYTLDCCICSHVAGCMFFLWKRFEDEKKKKEEKETLSILQQCFECERKASKWERFGPSDLNDNPRPFILIGRHQDRLKKGYARRQTCESMAFSRHFTPSELTCERKWHCWRFLRGFLLIWSSEEYLYSFFCAFPPSIQLYLVTVGSHTAWIVCMFHDI